jgi:hypothetical protein
MSKEYLAALIGKKPEDIEESTTTETFERLDGTLYESTVIKYDLTSNALATNCKKFYANKIKRASDDTQREKIIMEREKRIAHILRSN